MPLYDVAIIGAGPAGLLCARNAARNGLHVALVDSHEKPGVKLSIAGGGFGNITNRILDENRYIGEQTGILRSLLRHFSCSDALDLLRELHIPFEERDFGQIFSLEPASHIAQRLAEQCDNTGVDFYLGCTAKNFTKPERIKKETSASDPSQSAVFTFFAGQNCLKAKTLVIASGSPAYPQTGANDQLFRMASAWGHHTAPFHPVLVPLIMPDSWQLAGLEGISLNVRLGIQRSKKIFWPDPEKIRSLLFTHRGISGPAALVISCWWQKNDPLIFDFLPEIPVLELMTEKEQGRLLVKNMLSRRLPARLADALCPQDLARRKVAELSRQDRQRLSLLVHNFSAVPVGTEGMRRAEAASGGIALSSLSRNLESTVTPGLFFCGEVVDITGLLGGYNIHWALASGSWVAKTIAIKAGKS